MIHVWILNFWANLQIMFMNWYHQKISSKNFIKKYHPNILSKNFISEEMNNITHGWSKKIIHTYIKFESSLIRNIRVSWKLRAMSWCTFWCSRQATLKNALNFFSRMNAIHQVIFYSMKIIKIAWMPSSCNGLHIYTTLGRQKV